MSSKYITSFLNILKNNYIILAIGLLGFFLRWVGIYFDYPYVANNIWDEMENIINVVRIFDSKSLLASSSSYPALMTFLYMPAVIMRILYIGIREGLYSISEIKDYVLATGMGQIYIIIRWYAVFAGTSIIFLVYSIYKKIFKDKLVANISALVIAVNIIFVFLFHWGKLHSFMLFFLVLSLLFTIKFEEKNSIKYFYLSVLFSALSLSSHYLGASAIIFPLLLIIFNYKFFSKKIITYSVILYTGVVSVFFIAAGKRLFKDILALIKDDYASNNYLSYFPIGPFERFFYIFRDIFEISPIILVFSIIVIIFNLKRLSKHRYLRYILWGAVFNYMLMISVFTAPERTRMLAIFSLLIFSLAFSLLADYIKKKIKRKFLAITILFFLILPSFVVSASWVSLLSNNTSSDLVEWLYDNLSEQDYAYALERHYFNTQYSYTAALWERDKNGVKSSRLNYIIDNKEKLKNKRLNLVYDDNSLRFKELAGPNTKYVIIQYWNTGENSVLYKLTTKGYMNELISEISKYHSLELKQKIYPTKNYSILENSEIDYLNNPLNWWTIFKLKKSGPYIEIYEIK